MKMNLMGKNAGSIRGDLFWGFAVTAMILLLAVCVYLFVGLIMNAFVDLATTEKQASVQATTTDTQTVTWDRTDPAIQKNVATNSVAVSPYDEAQNILAKRKGTDTKGVVNYGGGLYYFPYTRAEFYNTLVWFKSVHTNLEDVASYPDFQNQYHGTHIKGYGVTFREKTPQLPEKP